VLAACLFSGGKESVFAIQTVQQQSVEVKHLIYEIPSFASPHAVNMKAVKTLAKSMNKHLTLIHLHEDGDELVAALKNLKVDALVAGDINVPQHVSWLNDKCSRAGKVKLLNHYGKKTPRHCLGKCSSGSRVPNSKLLS
jgi:diphthamide synthase (EF-2-diphthine--ammonia ligase)